MESNINNRSIQYIQSPSNAISYKCKCIDFYLKRFSCELIASEFRYGKLQLVTDLLFLTVKNIISIEIKAEHDDLRRLYNQIIEAKKNFNFIIVFAAAKHIESLLTMLPADVGITSFIDNKITIIRTPKRHILQSEEIIWGIPIAYLRRHFIVSSDYNSDETRDYILTKYKHRIPSVYREYLHSKFQTKYTQFLSDRGEETHLEDIPVLSMKEYITKL